MDISLIPSQYWYPPNDPEMHCITTLIRGVDTPISKVARQGLLTGGQR